MVRRNEPRGLGAEYERQVLGARERRERKASAFHATRLVYRAASWLLSATLSFAFFLVSFGIADAFLSSEWSLLPAFAALVILYVTWRRTWRRYRAPLFQLVPASEYERLRLNAPGGSDGKRSRFRLDLRIVKRVESEES